MAVAEAEKVDLGATVNLGDSFATFAKAAGDALDSYKSYIEAYGPSPVVIMPDPRWVGASDEQVLEAALEAVNLILAEHNVKPLECLPAGQQGNPEQCVISRALRSAGCVRVGTYGWAFRGSVSHPWPPAVREFVGRFDGGVYPELVERATVVSELSAPTIVLHTFAAKGS